MSKTIVLLLAELKAAVKDEPPNNVQLKFANPNSSEIDVWPSRKEKYS